MTTERHPIILSLASNTDQERHLQLAREQLATLLPGLRYTRELWTQPIGTKRTDLYLNQLATGETGMALETLNASLKHIEQLLGRKHDKSGMVTVDIDLLQYDARRLHLSDWERPYVKDLIEEI